MTHTGPGAPGGAAAQPPLQAPGGRSYTQPIFLPVYQPQDATFALDDPATGGDVEAVIVNAYFLYKQRELRRRLARERGLRAYLGFDGLIAADSGAFQGFSRQVYLKNKDIVAFQDAIGVDIASPLDVITPPGDKRTTAEAKLHATEKRVAEALRVAETAVVAGVQQGGRFADLRRASVERLLGMGVRYLALGSLVPFFTRNHDLRFPRQVIQEARAAAGPGIPIHVYGAGDPVELPFLADAGASVFDSSSYGHFADGGWYMTPFGALSDPGPMEAGEWRCPCAACAAQPVRAVMAERAALARHNLAVIHQTVRAMRAAMGDAQRWAAYLDEIRTRHSAWFPDSALPDTTAPG